MGSSKDSELELRRFSIEDLPPELNRQIRRRQFAAGETLFHEGDPADAIYFLESGFVRLLHYTYSGQTVDHYSVMTGEFFAEVLMVMAVCACTAIAEEVSKVLIIPKQAWLKTLRHHPDLTIAFAGELSHRLHLLKITLQLRGVRSARERVWNYLQIMANPETRTMTLDRPLKAIARDLDLTPETLSRVLSNLAQESTIQRQGKQIILLE